MSSSAGFGLTPPVSATIGGAALEVDTEWFLNNALTVKFDLPDSLPSGTQALTICVTDSSGQQACGSQQVKVVGAGSS
ncbi:MAG: hypothetical protein KGK07_17475, partial [Chloroflexota bacterium]|nr:hypothetical protein [Chloroflexota bacterium]